MMKVKVLFFATLRERAGSRQIWLDLPENTLVSEFKVRLVDAYPALAAGMPSALVAINREFALDDQVIPENAEMAVFPPVSGG